MTSAAGRSGRGTSAAGNRVVAVDVGGTEIKAALATVTASGVHIERHRRRRTPHGPPDAVIGAVAGLVGELREESEFAVNAVGIVVPGTVDEQRGVGLFSSNLGWRDAPLRELLAAHVELPVAFGHDVRAFGLAEARLGAARGFSDVVVMPIGTGMAAAMVLGGQLYAGGGYAGEIGHVDIGHGHPCPCGATGCLEALASSSAVARRYSLRTGRPVDGAAAVTAAVRAGDPDAQAVWTDAIRGLAKGILVLTTLVAPEAVVLGGGLALAGETLTAPLRAELDALLSFQRRPELRLATFGDEAGCVGAALLAADAVVDGVHLHREAQP